jgi:predicted nuclease of predicted toxin-antitoxin system
MILWIDAQLSPKLAPWITDTIAGIDAYSVRYIGLRDAKDLVIFMAAREANAIVVTKDRDFVAPLEQYGAPPKIIWLTCGNTSNAKVRENFLSTLPQALALLQGEEVLVQVRDATGMIASSS